MTIRTFIALELPENELKKIIELRDKNFSNYQKLKWEPIEKLHLTLKFLGNTPEEIIPLLISKLELLLQAHKSLNLGFHKFGLFYKDKKPRILWVGLKNSQELISLADDIDKLVSCFGFEKEKRKFQPHITLLRIKDDNHLKEINDFIKIDLPEINFEANKITLFKSTLLKSGSIYEPIKSFYLENKQVEEKCHWTKMQD